MKKALVGLSFAVLSMLAWALPTLQQVETEVQKGHLAQAETLMQEVIAAKPDSAKAHYIYAEILARNANFAKASAEARQARQLDPQISFTQPEKFRSFEQLLERQQHPQPTQARRSPDTALPPAMAPAAERSFGSGIPGWVWGAGLAALAVVAWRGFSRSRAAAAPYAGGAAAAPLGAGAAGVDPRFGGGGLPGAPSAYGPVNPPMGGGRGMLGTGLAAAGGVAAGMLASELLHRNSGSVDKSLDHLGPNNGLEPFGNAASDLEARPVDFGNGANWDSGGDLADPGSSDGGDW